MRNNKNRWTKPHHTFVRNVLAPILLVYCKRKYGIYPEIYQGAGEGPGKGQYLILYNHQTGFDQFFVAMGFKETIYYVASEDIFSMGALSWLIRMLVNPIPIKKQMSDMRAVKTCIRVAKEGGSIAIAPEGNRTYSGETGYINPAIGGLAKSLKLPILLYRLEGGYGVHPRWSDVKRKGTMRAYVAQRIEPAEYENMTKEELAKLISDGLYVNEGKVDRVFTHQKTAEYLERAVYVCPNCGLSVFESCDDIIKCTKCGNMVRYLPTKQLEGVNCEFPFEFMNQWYAYQNDFVRKLDLEPYIEQPMYEDKANFAEVLLYKHKERIADNAAVRLYGNRIEIDTEKQKYVMNFEDVSGVSVLGKNKLNIYYGDKLYQLKGSKRFNALKYVNIYYHQKNEIKEENNEQFLGL